MAPITLIRSVLATAIAAAALACAGDGSSALMAPPGVSALKRGVPSPRAKSAGKPFKGSTCLKGNVAYGAAEFGPGGGTLVFGTSSLIIPAGALKDTVTISATIVDTATTRVELLPHGLEFRKPAGLLLDASACDIDDPAPDVVYLSETGEVLETIPAVYDPKWKTIAAPIKHFSGYAIAF